MFGILWKMFKVLVVGSFLLGALVVFSVFYASDEARQHQEKLSSKAAEGWSVTEQVNKMDNIKDTIYSLQSQNTVNFKFPYSGKQRGRLVLRKKGDKFQDAYFSIKKGQMMCTLGCSARVRFGNEEPVEYSMVGPSDQSTETIFFKNHNAFIQNLKKVDSVLIEVTVYNEGQRVFEFSWSKIEF